MDKRVAIGLVAAHPAVAVVIRAIDPVAELVPAGERAEEVGGEILVERRVGIRAAAGGLAVALGGEEADDRVVIEGLDRDSPF